MQLDDLSGQKIYIYPLSDTTLTFSSYAKAKNAQILGFIDKNKKTLTNINSITLDEAKEFDYIVIYSPNHEREIYDFCTQSVTKQKLICVHLNDKKNYELHAEPIEMPFVKTSELLAKQRPNLQNEILFIGYSFIDLNIKYLYFYMLKHSNIPVHLATYNKRDYEMYKNAGFNITWLDSKEFVSLALKCKVKIIDQTPVVPFFINALKIGKCVQLWHGITIETLGILANYKALKYEIVLSTSPFVSEYSFSKIYDYKKIIHAGYPRNDILRGFETDIFNVNLNLLNEMKKHEFKYIIYAPTHRSNSFNANPLDYEKLDKFAKQNGVKFIMKMHPFIAEKLRDDLNVYKASGKSFENIIIYPANMDIYPIMPYCDMMIADYSSMYFDFLFVDKPIVFFAYDYDEWVLSEGGVCIDYFSVSPGDKAYTFDELLDKISSNLTFDSYKNERKRIKKLMFENLTKSSCEILQQEIESLL
ncbi:CDP-glycerol glycerophosphotransferase family protein [Campylobacter sputorum]|uniref:CDP-glycerol glycerophosphotransferase family protein n=1 Tax=Campylobacter sputorum TaxID=206 RepID=UPI000B7770A5|nr:CDP-glycerol glycerophosphotransferase family protein [Campylobacter sputorum]ASM37460.1 putative glycerophosphotransferase [Campylobacter sputorum bv. faecalis CCUG 20703]